MNTNENASSNALEDVIVLGVASAETKGPGVGIELAGPGQQVANGISEE